MYHGETILSTLSPPRMYVKYCLLEVDVHSFGIVSTDEMVDCDMQSKSSPSNKPKELVCKDHIKPTCR